MSELLDLADQLYALPNAEFTARRDELTKGAADRELKARIRALRKPTVAAWAANLLVRREAEQIDQVLVLAASLREAAQAMDGAELRQLTKQRRQLTAALTTTARALARESSVRLTQAVADQIEGVLNAAMLDPVAADVLRTGLLVTTFTSTGVDRLDPAEVLAVPEAAGSRATPVEAPERGEPGSVALHVVRDDAAVVRARLEDALAEAQEELTDATSRRERAQREVAELDARQLEIQARLDQLRRQLADAEADADDVETASDEAADELVEAKSAEQEARTRVETARRKLEQA